MIAILSLITIFLHRQTEQYFLALGEASKGGGMGMGLGTVTRRDVNEKNRELRQRQAWLVNFSAQVCSANLYSSTSIILHCGKEEAMTGRIAPPVSYSPLKNKNITSR